MDHGILFRQLPIESGILIMIPPTVEPDGTDRSVIGQQLSNLIIHKLIIRFPFSMGRTSRTTSGPPQRIIIVPVPIQMRIIKMQFYPLFMTFFCQFLQNIPAERCRLDDVVIRKPGIEHRKPLMMPGSKTNIFRSGRFYCSHPFSRIETGRIKSRSQLAVFHVVQVLVRHHPFSLSQHTIQPPM